MNLYEWNTTDCTWPTLTGYLFHKKVDDPWKQTDHWKIQAAKWSRVAYADLQVAEELQVFMSQPVPLFQNLLSSMERLKPANKQAPFVYGYEEDEWYMASFRGPFLFDVQWPTQWAEMKTSSGSIRYHKVYESCFQELITNQWKQSIFEETGKSSHLILTGHGSGAVLAHLYGLYLTINDYEPKVNPSIHVITFGEPPLFHPQDVWTIQTYLKQGKYTYDRILTHVDWKTKNQKMDRYWANHFRPPHNQLMACFPSLSIYRPKDNQLFSYMGISFTFT